jgi:hypothetical protein
MKVCIAQVGLAGDWEPLLAQLPSWRQLGPDWTDGVRRISPAGPALQSALVFGVAAPAWEAFARRGSAAPGGGVVAHGNEIIDLHSPSGVPLRLVRMQLAEDLHLPYVLNHCAIDVTDLNAEKRWYEYWLKCPAWLQRGDGWDPVAQRRIADAHLFSDPDFYITLRGVQGGRGLDHVGWMAVERDLVDQAAELLQRVRWPIVLGPTEIDGSYLVHFRGPDGEVHDFFHPAPELRQLAAGCGAAP